MALLDLQGLEGKEEMSNHGHGSSASGHSCGGSSHHCGGGGSGLSLLLCR